MKALAWFPEAAPESVRFVRDALARETGPKERANALLSLGILARYLDDRSDVPALLACLSPDEAPSVRLAAAISLAVILGEPAVAQQPAADKLVYPVIPKVGGVAPLPDAAEQPRKGAKVVFDITADARPAHLNKGLERVAACSTSTARRG